MSLSFATVLLLALCEAAPSAPRAEWLGGFHFDGFGSRVRALARFRGQWVAAGDFGAIGTALVRHIARFDGQRWMALGGPAGVGTDAQVTALAEYDDRLCAGGFFREAGGIGRRAWPAGTGSGGGPCQGPSGRAWTMRSMP